MLSRAALRAIRPSPPRNPNLYLTSFPVTATWTRTYADRPRRPPPSPPPSAAGRPTSRPPPPPPPSQFKGTGGPAKQTSPGTSIPKDQTWKPKDGIKLNSAAVKTGASSSVGSLPSAANAANRAEDEARATTSVDGTRPQDPVAGQSPLEDVAPADAQEPLAQKANLDEPAQGSVRFQAQDAQARAENTPPPPEHANEPQMPQQPLPDLRQGIPSTFDIEFGAGRRQVGDQIKARRPSEQTEGLDITATPPNERAREERDKEDREYDRSAYETSLDRQRARMANWLYAGLLVSSIAGALYLARPYGAQEDVPSHLEPSDATGWAPGKLYARLRARLGSQVGYYTEPTFPKLLPEVPANQRQPYTLVLSLEDLMIHTTWDRKHGYRTAKRPGIDYFIRYLSQYYELVLFTSVPLSMADPVIKKLDPYHFIMWPLGREATKYEGGEYVKDLSYLNRPLNKTIIIDTHAPHVKNQPENAIILPKWMGDPKDPHTGDLVRLIPFLEYLANTQVDDVRTVLASFKGQDIPIEFARRESLAREEFHRQLEAERAKRPKHSLAALGSALGIKSTPGMGGGLMLPDGQSVAEGLAQGKMLSDQLREAGQRQYEHIEKQIREHGAQWLKEEEEEQKRLMEAQMKDMKKSAWTFGGFLGGGGEGSK